LANFRIAEEFNIIFICHNQLHFFLRNDIQALFNW